MYNGDVGGVSGGNNAQWNKKLADKLDAADGKKDGKISASVWNGFIKHTGSSGNKIKWSITVNNASKSFSYYDTKKDVGKVDWNDWEDMYATFSKGKTDAGKPEQTTAPGGTSAASAASNADAASSAVHPEETGHTDEKPSAQQIMQDAGLKPEAKPDEQRLEYVTQTVMSDSADSLLQSAAHGNTFENIKNNIEQNPPMKREFPVNKTVTINDDGSKTIKYVYDDNGTNITDLRTIKENPDGSFIVTDANETVGGQRIKEQSMYKQNSDGTITKTVFRDDGKPGFVQTVDSKGHVISESEFKLGMNTGKEIEVRRNYFSDGSIEKTAFVNGERLDDFNDGETPRLGELQFEYVKDSPMKIVNSKIPTEAELLKAGYKLNENVMTTNGGKIYYNEQTGESVLLDDFSKTCEYRKGNITQKHSYDADGSLAYGTIEVKGENGAFETYTYQKNEDYKELTVTSANSHEAPTTPEAFAADALGGHWRNIDEFREELKLPKDLTSDIAEGSGEKISDDGNYKMKVTLGSDGNLMVVYSQKQDDGSFKEVGSYKLTKYDAPGTLRGYDFRFEAFNNLTGYQRTISSGDWRGDY